MDSDHLLGKNEGSKIVENINALKNSRTSANTESSLALRRQLREADRTISNRDVLIKILQEHLQQIEGTYKRSLDDIQKLRFQYCSTVQQLTNLKRAYQKVKDENQRLHQLLPKDATSYSTPNEKKEADQYEREFEDSSSEQNFNPNASEASVPKTISSNLRNIENLVTNQSKILENLVEKMEETENKIARSTSTNMQTSSIPSEGIPETKLSSKENLIKENNQLKTVLELSQIIDELQDYEMMPSNAENSIPQETNSALMQDQLDHQQSIDDIQPIIESKTSEDYQKKIKKMKSMLNQLWISTYKFDIDNKGHILWHTINNVSEKVVGTDPMPVIQEEEEVLTENDNNSNKSDGKSIKSDDISNKSDDKWDIPDQSISNKSDDKLDEPDHDSIFNKSDRSNKSNNNNSNKFYNKLIGSESHMNVMQILSENDNLKKQLDYVNNEIDAERERLQNLIDKKMEEKSKEISLLKNQITVTTKKIQEQNDELKQKDEALKEMNNAITILEKKMDQSPRGSSEDWETLLKKMKEKDDANSKLKAQNDQMVIRLQKISIENEENLRKLRDSEKNTKPCNCKFDATTGAKINNQIPVKNQSIIYPALTRTFNENKLKRRNKIAGEITLLRRGNSYLDESCSCTSDSYGSCECMCRNNRPNQFLLNSNNAPNQLFKYLNSKNICFDIRHQCSNNEYRRKEFLIQKLNKCLEESNITLKECETELFHLNNKMEELEATNKLLTQKLFNTETNPDGCINQLVEDNKKLKSAINQLITELENKIMELNYKETTHDSLNEILKSLTYLAGKSTETITEQYRNYIKETQQLNSTNRKLKQTPLQRNLQSKSVPNLRNLKICYSECTSGW